MSELNGLMDYCIALQDYARVREDLRMLEERPQCYPLSGGKGFEETRKELEDLRTVAHTKAGAAREKVKHLIDAHRARS